MNEMIERVARAICESEKMNPDDALGGWVHWVDAARASIEAMREPTDEMIERGWKDGNSGWGEGEEMPYIWRAMIDASLK